MTNIKIAYFGHPGSYSYLATLKFLEKCGIDDFLLFPCQSFEEVVDYVLVGDAFGVLPYYNNSAGIVHDYQALSEDYKNLVIDNIKLAVHHNLISLKGAKFSELTQVVSHPQALSQCKKHLATHYPKLKQVAYSTTSTAAYDLANGLLSKNSAIIASRQAAKKYGLKIIEANIEDSADNQTYFKVLRK